jgi:hypothetical protein
MSGGGRGSGNVAAVRQTLAKLDVGDGQEATIWRETDGTTGWSPGASGWFTVVSRGAGDPPVTSVPAGALVVGELPTGAASVDLSADKPVDDIVLAEGRFLALIRGGAEDGAVHALYRDDHGAIIPVQRESKELTRIPIEHPTVCPACGGRSWDQVEWRAGPDVPFTRERGIVCSTCGRPDGDEGYELVGRRRRPRNGEHPFAWESPLPEEPTIADLANAAEFTVFSVPGANVHRTSTYPGRVVSATVMAHDDAGEIEVTTAAVDDPERPRDHLVERSVQAFARSRGEGAPTAGSSNVEVRIAVDGQPTAFGYADYGDSWSAEAAVGNASVVLVARGVAPEDIELTSVARTAE